jgi:tRNA threonylcarbamoyladenosine biosynthesis protein TsaE
MTGENADAPESWVHELTEPALVDWAREVGRVVAGNGVFVCLRGELGSGKSTLARAACRGAGVTGPVPSPTFTLVNRYEVRGGQTLYHADLYRLDGPEGLTDMGWSDLVGSDRAVFVEWADRADGYLPIDRWEIRLDFVDDLTRRRVTALAIGDVPPVPAPREGSES